MQVSFQTHLSSYLLLFFKIAVEIDQDHALQRLYSQTSGENVGQLLNQWDKSDIHDSYIKGGDTQIEHLLWQELGEDCCLYNTDLMSAGVDWKEHKQAACIAPLVPGKPKGYNHPLQNTKCIIL